MNPPFIPDRIFPVSQQLVLTALWLGVNLPALDAQTTGSTNVPPTKDIYELQEIQTSLLGNRPLPIKLETYLSKIGDKKGEPEGAPKDEDIHWSASKGTPTFSPEKGGSVELDFGQPFVKEANPEARKVNVTASYSGSASVQPSSQSKDVERVYLDFWIAETEERNDDVVIVRAQDAQPTADEKKVIHWAKVDVKHSAPSALPLELISSGDNLLYFYGEEQDPNQRSEYPPLESTLKKELENGKWFWIGTDAKGTGQAKFKAKGDAGKGLKDAPEEKTVNLIPVDLISDLNNDGQITAADNPLRDAAMASGATDEIKDKGTEFLFVNDQLSNGLWDGEDSDPERPVAEKDDDAQEIKINPGITEGEVWLEHPAIAGLSFYETKECTGAKVNLYPASRYPVSSSNPFPDQLFVRADGTLTFPPANPQIEDDLVLKIKVGGANGQEIEAVKMKLTVVKDFGAKKYFQAANDYVLENNTELFVHEKAYGSVFFRLCLMREEETQVLPLELYEPAKDNWIQAGGVGTFSAYTYREAAGISEVMINDPNMTVVINGNQCGFTSGLSSAEAAVMSALGDPQITDKCQGRLKELNAAQSSVSNDHFDENSNIPGTLMKGSALAGPDPLPGITPPQAGGKYIAQYPDGKVVVGLNFAPDFSASPNPSYMLTQMGGLSTSYNSSDRSNYNNSVVGTAPIGGTHKKMVFVVMGRNGTVGKGKTVELYNSAVSSGVPQISGATTPSGSSPPITMTFLDSGVTSCALAYKKQNGNLSLLYKGTKHNGSPYYTNTFLRFKSSKPRP